MQPASRRLLYWTPRILAILFALFVSLFALDLLDEASGFRELATGLALHLIPVAALALLLVLAWRREWLGAVGFTTLALLYVAWSWGRFPFLTYAVMAGPPLLAGALFLLNWIHRAELRPR